MESKFKKESPEHVFPETTVLFSMASHSAFISLPSQRDFTFDAASQIIPMKYGVVAPFICECNVEHLPVEEKDFIIYENTL